MSKKAKMIINKDFKISEIDLTKCGIITFQLGKASCNVIRLGKK